jgi:hypothetical protein
MTPAEIDRALADELGWSVGETEMEDSDSISGRSRQKVYLTIEGVAVRWGNMRAAEFSPSTNRDHFAEYVLPEIEGRGMWTEFEQRLYAVQFVDPRPRGHERPTLRWFAKAPPLTLAAAALAVLEGKP